LMDHLFRVVIRPLGEAEIRQLQDPDVFVLRRIKQILRFYVPVRDVESVEMCNS
jgi:hypothetical protein